MNQSKFQGPISKVGGTGKTEFEVFLEKIKSLGLKGGHSSQSCTAHIKITSGHTVKVAGVCVAMRVVYTQREEAERAFAA